jgi:ribonuclease R
VKHRPARAPERAPAGPVVGVLAKHGRFWTAEPFFARGRRVNVDRPRNAGAGDLVLVAPVGRGAGHGRILRRIGRPDIARDVLEALMLDRGLRRRFDPLVEREAREPRLPDVPRRDLRDLPTFTIDPPTARDFDDAISAEALDDGAVRVWVHIADVAAHVRPGSHVDREAFKRGTSVYVPGLVEPMLPEALSNQACSLVPYQDRLAVTVELDLAGSKVRRSAFHRSIIRSDKRLAYPEVDAIFAGAAQAEEPWAAPLAAARRAAAALHEARQGALDVETTEPEFDFSREGHVTALVPSEQTESHRLIEHLMIAANEAVATLLETRKLPALYRVHERPEPARVEQLADQLASLDVPTPPLRQSMTPQQAADAVAEMALLVTQEVRRRGGQGRIAFTSLVLRSLKQALYSPRNLGHAGLRSPRYCHFTSPIRRYPDLVCHRSLLSAIGAGEDLPAGSRLDSEAEWCSQRERDAADIERRADAVARCFLLETELFETGWDRAFEGEVTGVIGAGAFVAFGDGHEGMLPVRRLVGDWWELNELETMLIGAGSGDRIRLGDTVSVRVEKVDAPRGRVDLVPA